MFKEDIDLVQRMIDKAIAALAKKAEVVVEKKVEREAPVQGPKSEPVKPFAPFKAAKKEK